MRTVWVVIMAAAAAPEPRAQETTEEVLRSATASPGVCVQLGAGDGTLTARLAENGNLLVQALDAEPRRVDAAREFLHARGLYGAASVELWTSKSLPHADHLVNVVVAEAAGFASEAEILRVLVPDGRVWLKEGNTWRTIRKPIPKEFGEWTHSRHGADGNRVSEDSAVAVPSGLRWVAGPPQDAGGRWQHAVVMLSAAGRNFYVHDGSIEARDAYNGRRLWTRPISVPSFTESGAVVQGSSKEAGKAGTRTSKVSPVAARNRLYVAHGGKLVGLDAATGRDVLEFGPVEAAREILVDEGRVILLDRMGVRAFDADTAARAWVTPLEARGIAAGGASVFCLSGDALVCLDAGTGKERWRARDSRLKEALNCCCHSGVVAVGKSTLMIDGTGCGILVFSGKDGRLLWTRDYRPGTYYIKEVRPFFAQGLLWLHLEENPTSWPPRPKVVGLDPWTGGEKKSWPSGGSHCATPVASHRYFMAPECDFTDLETGAQSRARMFRNACRVPFIPANGLLYTFPHHCVCYPILRGYMALAPGGRQNPQGERLLLKGPAVVPNRPPHQQLEKDVEWPAYRRDAYRSNATPAPLRNREPRPVWTVPVARPAAGPLADDWKESPFVRGTLTAPVAARERVIVAVPHEHRVVAMDAKTGKPRWSFTAGGRIDTPPTLDGDLCLFGSHDGWIYAVDLASGGLRWKYRAAPHEARIMAYGQLESLWPVAGSILVEKGVAYVAAGRHPLSDGGIRVSALTVESGALIWEKTIDQLNLKEWYGPLAQKKNKTTFKLGIGFEPVDLMVKDGDGVSMSRWRFDAASGAVKLDLGSTEYEAPGGLDVPRGAWGYGTTRSLHGEPRPAAFDQGKLHFGRAGDLALILAGGTPVTCDQKGEVAIGPYVLRLDVPPVHDGLIAAYGRLYMSGQDGSVRCLD